MFFRNRLNLGMIYPVIEACNTDFVCFLVIEIDEIIPTIGCGWYVTEDGDRNPAQLSPAGIRADEVDLEKEIFVHNIDI